MSVAEPVLPEYAWLVVVGALAAWAFGFGTGANDVANAFGTSVGAKTLSLRQAVLIAIVFEFTGAIVLGRVSTSTISGGIADINAFTREPEVFAYGMICALTVSAIWQVVASYYELNVSATHSIIGSIIGFALVYDGNNAVLWQVPDPDSFPPYRGVLPIVVSWFFSPIFTALAAAFFFFLIRVLVLRRPESASLSFWVLPPFVVLTVFICVYFVLTKGARKMLSSGDDGWTDSTALWVAAAVGISTGLIVVVVILPILRWRTNQRFHQDGTLKDRAEAMVAAEKGAALAIEGTDEQGVELGSWHTRLRKGVRAVYSILTHGTEVNIHEVVEDDELVNAIHNHAEVFDPKAEFAFQYLQVFSAVCVVFAHGAGEVGYMAGPLATVWFMYTEGKLKNTVQAPVWVVLIGACGLVVGLATYGYNVTRAMGVKLSKLSPTRGFCAELATAFVIMIASQYGLPTSSSQCITGGIIGVGLMEGKLGVNWGFFMKQFASWVATLFIAGICTAALFAQGYYAPGFVAGKAQISYENYLTSQTAFMFDNYREVLETYRDAALAGQAGTLTNSTINKWAFALNNLTQNVQQDGGTTTQTVQPAEMWAYMNIALSLYQKSTIVGVGQKRVFPGSLVCHSNVTSDILTGRLVPCPTPELLLPGAGPPWEPPI